MERGIDRKQETGEMKENPLLTLINDTTKGLCFLFFRRLIENL